MMERYYVISIGIVVAVWFLVWCALGIVQAPAQPHSNPWLLTWIPKQCCVTNDCCFEVSARDVESLPDDAWKILASGQVLKRTNWSPNGKYYRCACDNIDGNWVVRAAAFTRCIFPPMRMTWKARP